MGADDDVDLAARESRLGFARLFGVDEARKLAHASPGNPRSARLKVRKCWRASSVVGTTTATCSPAIAATKAARSATSVLPKPTSPQTSRSIGRPLARSSIVSAMAFPGLRFPDRESARRIRHRGLAADRWRAAIFSSRAAAMRISSAAISRTRCLHARLALLPARAAEPVELRRAFVRAVARQKFDVLDRQEQLAAVILQLQAIMRRAGDVDGLQARDSGRCRARYG